MVRLLGRMLVSSIGGFLGSSFTGSSPRILASSRFPCRNADFFKSKLCKDQPIDEISCRVSMRHCLPKVGESWGMFSKSGSR